MNSYLFICEVEKEPVKGNNMFSMNAWNGVTFVMKTIRKEEATWIVRILCQTRGKLTLSCVFDNHSMTMLKLDYPNDTYNVMKYVDKIEYEVGIYTNWKYIDNKRKSIDLVDNEDFTEKDTTNKKKKP